MYPEQRGTDSVSREGSNYERANPETRRICSTARSIEGVADDPARARYNLPGSDQQFLLDGAKALASMR